MIKINELRKTYDKNTRHANEVLHGISLTLDDTGFVCILGQSGCGKTSLLNAIGGLDNFDGGSITTDNSSEIRSSEFEIEAQIFDLKKQYDQLLNERAFADTESKQEINTQLADIQKQINELNPQKDELSKSPDLNNKNNQPK